jgi:hypothetical protein
MVDQLVDWKAVRTADLWAYSKAVSMAVQRVGRRAATSVASMAGLKAAVLGWRWVELMVDCWAAMMAVV